MTTDTLAPVTELMIELVPTSARDALRQSPTSVVAELWPNVDLVPLAAAPTQSDECSCDAYYDTELIAGRPQIIYADDPSPRRIRFTLLHEIGHHLIRTVEPELLDLLDDIAGNDATPDDLRDTEERACHAFAGALLVPGPLFDEVVGARHPRPDDVITLYRRSGASWEATAVGVATRARAPTAIALIRTSGSIAFCASSPGLRPRWARGSKPQPDGPLDRALTLATTAKPDTYRFDLAYARAMWCDIRHPHNGLAIAVLSDKPSNGDVNILPEAPKPWDEDAFCERCGGARTVDWCDDCHGKRCEECQECGCYHRAPDRLCEGACTQHKGLGAFTHHDTVCNDCLNL